MLCLTWRVDVGSTRRLGSGLRVRLYGRGGELNDVARRDANYYQDLLERAETELETLPVPGWLAGYGRQIGEVRVALDWAFSPTGAAEIGVARSVAAVL